MASKAPWATRSPPGFVSACAHVSSSGLCIACIIIVLLASLTASPDSWLIAQSAFAPLVAGATRVAGTVVDTSSSTWIEIGILENTRDPVFWLTWVLETSLSSSAPFCFEPWLPGHHDGTSLVHIFVLLQLQISLELRLARRMLPVQGKTRP